MQDKINELITTALRSNTISISDRKRVFIAINLSEEIKQTITNIQAEIKSFRDIQLKMKFVERKNLHISLKFLGDLSPLEIKKILLILQKISLQNHLFLIELAKNIGVFPDPKRPRVIWIGLEKGYHEIEKIYQDIELEFRKESFYRYDKKFTAHITLGRVKYLKYSNKLIEHLENIQVKNISQKVHSIELMESHLAPEGPTYTIISRFQLSE